MARTRPMARKSTGGNAPRRTFAKKKARILGENGEEKCVDVVTCASCSAVVPESTATHAVEDSDCDELGEHDDDEEEDDDKVFVCSAPHCQANLAITKIKHRQATRERALFYQEMHLKEASSSGRSGAFFFDGSCVDPLGQFRYWVRPMETLTPDEIADPQNAISAYENKRHEKRGARMKRLNELDDIWNKLPEGEEKELARKNLVEFLESSKNAFHVFRGGIKSDSESSGDDDDDEEKEEEKENST